MHYKTILYTHGWLGKEEYYKGRLNWLEYYKNLKDDLGYDIIYYADNASPIELVESLPKDNLIIHRFDNHLQRTSHLGYEYHWRSIYHIRDIIKKYNPDKINLCEWDFYLLNSNITNYIKNSNSGIEVFFCQKYNFPESNFFTINRNAYPIFMNFTSIDWKTNYLGKQFENIFPFTKITTNFKGDRYGETKLEQTKDMDYYCQTPSSIKLKYNL